MTFFLSWPGIISHESDVAWDNSLCWVVPCSRSSLGTVWGQGCSCQPQGCCAIQTRMQGAASRAGRQPHVCVWVPFGGWRFSFICFFNSRKQKHHSECLPSPGDSSQLSLCLTPVKGEQIQLCPLNVEKKLENSLFTCRECAFQGMPDASPDKTSAASEGCPHNSKQQNLFTIHRDHARTWESLLPLAQSLTCSRTFPLTLHFSCSPAKQDFLSPYRSCFPLCFAQELQHMKKISCMMRGYFAYIPSETSCCTSGELDYYI